MKISLLQNDIVWGNPKANQEACEKIMKSLEKSDVYVLPEMFSTGFATQPAGIAEADGASLEWMKRMADKLDAAVCGSVAVCEEKPSSIHTIKINFSTVSPIVSGVPLIKFQDRIWP